MDVQSQHLLVDVWLERELSPEMIQDICDVIENNLTVIKKTKHQFEPIGETIVFILGESHFSLHTYPEHNYLTMDIYVCNRDVDLESILKKIQACLPIKHQEYKFVTRGVWEEFEEKSLEESNAFFKKNFLYAITFILASCSIIYELLLAQALSSTMGNTALRYNITVGLYIASMGVGALLFNKIFKDNYKKQLIKVELALALIGGLAPIIVLTNDTMMNLFSLSIGVSFFSSLTQNTLSLLNHSLIVCIGFLSGLELPLLIELGKKIKKSYGTKVLAVDYAGTLFGVVSFPLVIFPYLSLFTIGYLIAFLNSSVALYLVFDFFKSGVTFSSRDQLLKFGTMVVSLLFFMLLVFSERFNEAIINNIYFYNL